ncbi:hypothetical protein EOL70_02280 [Leucothrix sargassi]|nr:hypothetical protein EOL70_02280 [Leucothrix sargassi]
MRQPSRKSLSFLMLATSFALATNSYANSSALEAKNVTTSVLSDTVENTIALPSASDADSALLEIVSYPSNGVLTYSAEGSEVMYTPDSGYVGTDSYSYRVSNEIETSNTATVSVDVIAANPGNAISNYASKGVVSVNGDITDWVSLNLFDYDAIDVPFTSTDRIDLRRAGLSHTDETAFIVYENRNIVDPDNSSDGILVWGWQAFLDTDNNPSSGFLVNDNVGADYLAEGKSLYRYNGDGVSWSWVKVGHTNPRFETNIVELSFPRSWLGSHSDVTVAFVGNNRAYGGTSIDFYPEDSGFAYSFGNSFVGVTTEVVEQTQGTETSSGSNNPFETTTETTVTTTMSVSSTNTSNKSGGGSASWAFLLLPLLLAYRRFRA